MCRELVVCVFTSAPLRSRTVDISPSARFCITEAEIVTALYNGIYKGVYGHKKTWGGDVQRLFVPEWHNFFAQDGGAKGPATLRSTPPAPDRTFTPQSHARSHL